MAEYLDEVNRVMDRFAANSDVVATALTGREDEILVLSENCDNCTQNDEWSRGFDLQLEAATRRDALVERRSTLANARVKFLFGDPGWFFADPRLGKCWK